MNDVALTVRQIAALPQGAKFVLALAGSRSGYSASKAEAIATVLRGGTAWLSTH